MTKQPGRWQALLLIALAAWGPMCAPARAQQDTDEINSLAAESWREGTDTSKQKAFQIAASLNGDARPALPWLVDACRDPNPAIRNKGAFFLGLVHAEPARCVPVLATLLKDPDPSVRSAAAIALARFGRRAKGAIPALVEAANAPSERFCPGAELALASIGDAAIPELARLLKASDPSRRARVLQGIQQGASWPRGMTFAIALAPCWNELIHDPHPMVRAQLAQTLVMLRSGTPRVLAALRILMKDSTPGVRVAVVKAFGSAGWLPDELHAPFLERLADRDRDVRAQAAGAIPQPDLADPVVIDRLLELLKDPEAVVRSAAGASLLEARRVYFSPDRQNRIIETSRALLQHPTAGMTLLSAMKDTRPDVRRFAAMLIPAFPEIADRSVPVLIRQLSDRDPLVRSIAASSLGQMRPAPLAAVRPLLAVVAGFDAKHQEDQQAAIDASTALAAMGGPAKAKVLRLILSRLKALDEAQRGYARQALLAMGDSVVDDLLRVVADARSPRDLQVEAVGSLMARAMQDDTLFDALPRRAAALAAVATLRALAKADDAQTSIIALALLAAIDPSDADVASSFLDFLRSNREKDDPELKQQWIACIIKPPMIPTLVKGLQDRDASLRFETLKVLQMLAEPLGAAESSKLGAHGLSGGAELPPITVGPDSTAHLPLAWAGPQGHRRRREASSLLVRSLLPCLMDREFRNRWAAAETLGVLHAEPELALPALIKMIETEGGRLPVDGLTFHPFPLDYTIGRSDKGTDPLRLAAIRALCGFGREASCAVPVLVPFLKDEDPRVQWFVAQALANIGPEARAAVPALIEAVQSEAVATGKDEDNLLVAKKAPIRLIAAYALGQIGPDARRSVPALMTAVAGSDSRVRLAAAWALGQMGEAASPAVPALVRLATRGSNHQVASRAAESLRDLGPIARKALIAAMHDVDVVVRVNALGVLTEARGATVVPIAEITRCLNGSDAEVRVAAGSAIAMAAGRPEAVAALPRLLAALGDRDSEVVAAAANAVTCILRPLMSPLPVILSPAHPFRPEPDDGFEQVERPIGDPGPSNLPAPR